MTIDLLELYGLEMAVKVSLSERRRRSREAESIETCMFQEQLQEAASRSLTTPSYFPDWLEPETMVGMQ